MKKRARDSGREAKPDLGQKEKRPAGIFATIVRELCNEDCAGYNEIMRIDHAQVFEIFSLIEKEIAP